MFAIIQLGSSQVKVAEGDIVTVSRVRGEAGQSINIDKVLMFASGDDIRVGRPFLPDVQVMAKILEHPLGEKVIAFKFRRRKNSARKRGHRIKLTALNITKIAA